jgi:hypothetical protein
MVVFTLFLPDQRTLIPMIVSDAKPDDRLRR